MKLIWTLFALTVASSCINFDREYENCRDAGHCLKPAAGTGGSGGGEMGGGGATGGGTATGGGGSATGGGSVATGGGSATGGGGGQPCQTCLLNGLMCVPPGVNKNNMTCGGGGITCVDCTQNSQTCDPTTLTCASWQNLFTEQTNDPLLAAWAVVPGEAWFAGVRSSLVHFSQNQPSARTTSGRANALFVVGDAGSATIYAAGSEGGQGFINTFSEPWDGGTSPGVRQRPTNSFSFYTVFPAGDEVYVAGRSFVSSQSPMVFKRDGGTWAEVTPATLTGAVNDGFGLARGDYYLVTSASLLAHKTPGGFTTVPLGGYPNSIWGTAQGTLWIAGDQFFARLNADGGVQEIDAGRGGVWQSIWAADDSAVFLAGSDPSCGGIVVRYDGTGFRRTCLSPQEVISIHGTSATDVWASDIDGGIWHYGP